MIRIDPIYPVGARTAGIEGWTCLVFTVTAEGHVRDAKVSVSAPEGYFEVAALKAVRQWRYQPGAADTPGNVVLLKFEIAPPATPPATPTVYLGAFTITATDQKPIIIKDCDPVGLEDAESLLNTTVTEFESRFNMTCEQQADNQSYMCVDQARRTIARIRLWQVETGCKMYPVQFMHDAKALLNRR